MGAVGIAIVCVSSFARVAIVGSVDSIAALWDKTRMGGGAGGTRGAGGGVIDGRWVSGVISYRVQKSPKNYLRDLIEAES